MNNNNHSYNNSSNFSTLLSMAGGPSTMEQLVRSSFATHDNFCRVELGKKKNGVWQKIGVETWGRASLLAAAAKVVNACTVKILESTRRVANAWRCSESNQLNCVFLPREFSPSLYMRVLYAYTTLGIFKMMFRLDLLNDVSLVASTLIRS